MVTKFMNFLAVILSVLSLSLSIFNYKSMNDYLVESQNKIAEMTERLNKIEQHDVFNQIETKAKDVKDQMEEGFADLTEAFKKNAAKALKELSDKIEGEINDK